MFQETRQGIIKELDVLRRAPKLETLVGWFEETFFLLLKPKSHSYLAVSLKSPFHILTSYDLVRLKF